MLGICSINFNMDIQDTIYIVAIGDYRKLHCVSYGPSIRRNADFQNLCYPRSRILIGGTAHLDEILPGIESTWSEYMKPWAVDGLWLAASKSHPSPGAPPPPGAMEHIMATLQRSS